MRTKRTMRVVQKAVFRLKKGKNQGTGRTEPVRKRMRLGSDVQEKDRVAEKWDYALGKEGHGKKRVHNRKGNACGRAKMRTGSEREVNG